MKMAFCLFNGMTTLDFDGFHHAVSWLRILNRLDGVSLDLCALAEEVTDDRGMTIRIPHVRPDLSAYDLLFVPGGLATRQLRHDEAFLSWLRTAREDSIKVSVCTGALLLGAAGWLTGKRATTNRTAYDLLAPSCAEVVQARAVRDGRIFTGAGVSASLDLGLYVVESLTDALFAQEVQEWMEYPYYRPGSAANDLLPEANGPSGT
ncbi:thiazole biosynthesis protein ThiJ [Paenibacillus sp. J31TS4]|uniref:DJ-1/PfpI family protein n=1 Tax=Paenibacillus sp. J31TS4 TaxID=2807195 RepID=UPI001B06BC36|nr:DJ-1/PfpI family protein [Paenibacillus sp. J31TS4]GIP39408.1 thiazole biosynthesis protein ThiJ [Paenibacillus sp. J31TS4]